jgi:hypothetical protein
VLALLLCQFSLSLQLAGMMRVHMTFCDDSGRATGQCNTTTTTCGGASQGCKVILETP